jgi:hypothetical protein
MADDSDSHAIGKEPCPDCGSKDNLVRYSDGHAFCFSQGCGRFEPGDDAKAPPAARSKGHRRMADFLHSRRRLGLQRGSRRLG